MIWERLIKLEKEIIEVLDKHLVEYKEPGMDRFNNGLAGWVSTFTLTTHNDRPRCLYNLYPSGSAY